MFRKNAFTSKRADARVEAAVLADLERYLTVEDILGLPSARWDQPRDAPYAVRHDGIEADRAADALRRHWGLGDEPVPNLVELLEERGVKIFALPLDTVGGLAARARRAGLPPVPVVVVNAEDWGERQRFTIAHELGHIVLDVSRGLDAERVAHRFAGAFLMPAEALRLEVGKRRSGLEIIGAATWRALFNEFGRLGWRSPPQEEYSAMAGELPNRFGRLCLRALAEGAISKSKAAELVAVGIADVDDYMRGVVPSAAAAG